MSARYVVAKAHGVDGPPIPEDEPCIVIRGQDFLALRLLDQYVYAYRSLAPHPNEHVLADLADHRERLVRWQEAHRTKWADR